MKFQISIKYGQTDVSLDSDSNRDGPPVLGDDTLVLA